MKRGIALVKARQILGPAGHVRHSKATGIFHIGTFDERGWILLASGVSWEAALACLPKARASK